MYCRTDENRQRIGPWDGRVLVPPTGHNYCYIKTEHKRQWYEATIFIAILDHLFKYSVKKLQKRITAVKNYSTNTFFGNPKRQIDK